MLCSQDFRNTEAQTAPLSLSLKENQQSESLHFSSFIYSTIQLVVFVLILLNMKG